MQEEAADLPQTLEDRKVIERAKGILMRRLRLGEEEAFLRMRTLASHETKKLAAVARKVLEADRIFSALDDLQGVARPPARGGGTGATGSKCAERHETGR